MTEGCANCGSPEIALQGAGWITDKPKSFKRSPHLKKREMLYLCPTCFRREMLARELHQDQLRGRIRRQFGI
jgi:hypothetical protein